MLLVLPLASSDAATPKPDPLCSLNDSRYRVELVREGPCCPNELEFLVEEKESGRTHALHFKTRINRVRWMRILDDSRLLVVGRFQPGSNVLLLNDLKQEPAPEEIWSYGHQFSPSKRLIVYATHYSTTAPPEAQRSILLLYQLARSPAQNRVGEPAALDVSNAGIPIFPERNAAERSYDPSLEPKHVYLSPFLWSPDEDKIVFFESFDGSYHLVTVDLSRGLDSPRIARRTVEVEEVVKEESRGRLTERQIEAKWIAVVDLRWKDDRNVVLRLHADEDVREVVELPIP